MTSPRLWIHIAELIYHGMGRDERKSALSADHHVAGGIPFQVTIPAPFTREEMDDATFNAFMQRGIDEAKAGKGCPASGVIADLRSGL